MDTRWENQALPRGTHRPALCLDCTGKQTQDPPDLSQPLLRTVTQGPVTQPRTPRSLCSLCL